MLSESAVVQYNNLNSACAGEVYSAAHAQSGDRPAQFANTWHARAWRNNHILSLCSRELWQILNASSSLVLLQDHSYVNRWLQQNQLPYYLKGDTNWASFLSIRSVAGWWLVSRGRAPGVVYRLGRGFAL